MRGKKTSARPSCDRCPLPSTSTMHPSLRFSAKDLPLRLRNMARAAANGSLEDLSRLCSAAISVTDRNLLLPVFYSNLEVEAIPTAAALDADSPPLEVRAPITKAVLALRGIAASAMPSSACSEIWPRLWKWTLFLYTYHEQLPPLLLSHPPTDVDELCANFLNAVVSFHHEHRNRELFCATPGFVSMMARAWRVLVRGISEAPLIDFGIFQMSYFFSTYLLSEDPRILEEFIEGSGGSIQHVAGLVVQHLDRTRRDTVSSQALYSLRGVLLLVNDIDEVLLERAAAHDDAGPLVAALVHSQAVRTLTTVACELGASPSEDSELTRDRCYKLLAQIFDSPSGYRLLPKAIEVGLLIALASSTDVDDDRHVLMFLNRILPSASVYCMVLSTMPAALDEIAEIEMDEAFLNSKLFPEWQKFRVLSDERLRILEHCRGATFSARAACDNLACGRIGPKQELKRCSRCQSARYCSAECQLRDWRYDNHRKLCDPHRAFCLNENTHFSALQRSFFRLLLDEEYSAGGAAMLELRFLRRFGVDDTPMVTVFDYSVGMGVADISILALGSAAHFGLAGAQWDAEFARVARSGGRVRLHVIRVSQDYWLVPLRSESSAVYDGMKAIAAGLPPDFETWDVGEVEERIRGLFDGGMEIH
ncbi:hypothetical protein C8R46DRAFT_1184380 [Mycena filopes]|nr:hypothetical protein C8R46DRAFT_1184380 [Mycena filopes]